jgi:hypothetical protein
MKNQCKNESAYLKNVSLVVQVQENILEMMQGAPRVKGKINTSFESSLMVDDINDNSLLWEKGGQK